MDETEQQMVDSLRRAEPAAADLAVRTSSEIQRGNQLEIVDGVAVNARNRGERQFKRSPLKLVENI